MGRPQLQPGEHGEISTRLNPTSTNPATKYKASARHRDPITGVVSQRSATGATKTDARRALAARLDESVGARAEARSLTLQEAALEWLDTTSKLGRWQPTTVGTYRRSIRVELAAVANLTLAEAAANPRAVRTFIRAAAGDSIARGRRVRTILRQTFAWAHDEGLISGPNPVAQIPMPRKEAHTVEIVPESDLAELLRVADLGPWYVSLGVRVMVGSGLRIGEMLALRVRDVELDERGMIVNVNGTIIVPDRGPAIRRHGKAKTAASLRRLFVGGPAAEALLTLVQRAGTSSPDTLLFAGRGGVVMSPANWRRTWRSVRSASPVTARVHPHQLRATFATLAIQRGGWSAEITADALGHGSGTQVLFQHYFKQAPVRGLPDASSVPSAPTLEITA